MARINIEDSLYADNRWLQLVIKCGCQYKAKGILFSAWALAQKNWLAHRCIPGKAWSQDFEVLIEVELATRRADGTIYIKGSKKAFAWLEQRSEAGAIGGSRKSEKKTQAAASNGSKGGRPLSSRSLKDSENRWVSDEKYRREKSKSKSNVLEENPSGTQAEPKREESEPKLLTPTLSHSPSLPLFSDSDSKKDSVLSEHSKKAQLFVGTYCQLFKARYGMNPKILGKDAGIASRLSKQLSEDDIKKLLHAFFSMPDAWLVKAKHPVGSFEMKLNEIVVFANSGNFTTKTQANQADAFATNAVLLDQVRRGEA